MDSVALRVTVAASPVTHMLHRCACYRRWRGVRRLRAGVEFSYYMLLGAHYVLNVWPGVAGGLEPAPVEVCPWVSGDCNRLGVRCNQPSPARSGT